MSEACIFVEGGGNRNVDDVCRKGFRQLLQTAGFTGRIPRIFVCGSRNEAYRDFKTAIGQGVNALLIVDSEDPVSDITKTWEHLKTRDGWERPTGATDEQVFLMTTCMETWLVADRGTLRTIYRADCLNESALPNPLGRMEGIDRHAIQDALERATKDCKNAFKKGKRSFAALAQLNPEVLRELPSFQRMCDILDAALAPAKPVR